MPKPQSFQVAGVDGCKAGWLVAIAFATQQSAETKDPYVSKFKGIVVASTFAEVLSKTDDCELVCVDIPIGLSDGNKPRECDIAARRLLGGQRASSVFPALIRPCLSTQDYKAACEISFQRSGKKLSRQSFALLDKIRQVDDLMTPALQNHIREIHPEISFWALNGKKPTQHKKKGLAGCNERMELLSPIFSGLKEIVTKARKPKQVAPDDILDAIVAAWTAIQTAMGNVTTLPPVPELDSKGLRMEILLPSPS